MPAKKILTERPCKKCSKIIPFIPRRVYCVECYKKHTNFKPETFEIKFINDD